MAHDDGLFGLFSLFINLLMLTGPIFMLQVYDRVLGSRSEATLVALAALVVASGLMLASSGFYASFIREHKPLRYYTNPSYYIYSTIKVARQELAAPPGDSRRIAEDAHLPEEHPHKELLIFVLGETARYDRFSLNGYERETNPLLKKEEIYAFSNFWSCGTSTAVSVPCMFSIYDKDSYSESEARRGGDPLA